MQIGVLSKKAGLNPRTIRYYEQIGVLPAAPRTQSGYRQYTEQDRERLEFIRNAQTLGVTLDEIKEVLAFRDRGVSPCPYVLRLIDAKVEEIQDRIRGLQLLAGDLRRLRRAAARLPQARVAAKARFCHILENRNSSPERVPGIEGRGNLLESGSGTETFRYRCWIRSFMREGGTQPWPASKP